MRIRLEDLQEGDREYRDNLAVEEIEGGPDELRLEGPLTYRVRASLRDGEILLLGGLRATVGMPCSRCLEASRYACDRRFELRFRRREAAPTDPETQLDEADLDVDYYAGDSLDLVAVLLEQVRLALPMKLLCGEECRGLCPQCGSNRNRESCDCRPPVDPRLAPLAALRDRL